MLYDPLSWCTGTHILNKLSNVHIPLSCLFQNQI